MENHIIIMAGGVGSRLFPLSTPAHPKQFLDILGTGKTLIQATYERFVNAYPDSHFWILTSREYIHFIHEQLPHIPDEQILAEPVPRNTAPCIAYACWKIRQRFPNANIAVTPADAFIPDIEAFGKTMRLASDYTNARNEIICIGIKPTSPHTGYGYIKCPDAVEGEISKVECFKEKPDLATASSYLEQGGYWWNAGIFVWNVDTIEKAIRAHAPQIAAVMDQIAGAFYTASEEDVVNKLFPSCEKISIDYAVIEKSDNVYTTPVSWEWSDLGSFEAIERVRQDLHSQAQRPGCEESQA